MQELGLLLQMEAQLLVQFGILSGAMKQRVQPLARRGNPPHMAPPVASSTQFTAATERSHCERVAGQFTYARRRQQVIACAAVVLGRPPFGANQASRLHPLERWVEAALVHLEHLPRRLPDAEADAPAVQRLERERLQDQQLQRSLEQIGLVVRHDSSWWSTRVDALLSTVKRNSLSPPNSLALVRRFEWASGLPRRASRVASGTESPGSVTG